MPKIYLLTFLLALNFSCSQGNLLRKYHSNAPEKIDKRPNIVIIMADDLGYSDLGCYGGEIQTPNLDQLAQNGIRFTQFYNGARCCPTRASLLTGKYPHQVGLAFNGHNLSTDTPTLAELLKDQGYSTGMTGKWHLSKTQALHNREEQLQWLAHHKDSSRFADPATYPFNRGFEEHWGVIWGVVNFFDPFSLVHNEEAISDVSEDFYMTDFISDKSVELIDQFHKKDKPFFLYIAHTAPHWPLHALPEDIKKYEGVYDKGWEELRKTRVHGLISQAIIDPKTAPPTLNESGLEWEDCEQKSWESAHMEAHAAMVDRMDQGIGRVIAKLKETDELENTLILFLADNGASPERYFNPGFDRPDRTRTGKKILYTDYEKPGSEKTWGYLGAAWAGAINAPFRYWKKESFEGGNCTPLIAHWPKGLEGKENTINHGIGHVMDIAPTCLSLAGADYPVNFNNKPLSPMEGNNLMPLFKGAMDSTNDTLFWEHQGGKALRIGDWKIVALNNKEWELFDLSIDRTESNDLSKHLPEKVKAMEQVWKSEWKRIYSEE